MDIKQRVVKLLDNKRKIEKEIEDIQLNCSHYDKVIRHIQTTSTSYNPRWICEDCNKLLGYPTDFELNKVNFFGKKH